MLLLLMSFRKEDCPGIEDNDDSYDTDDKVSVKELMQMLKAELQ